MDRRDFLRRGTTAAAALAASDRMLTPLAAASDSGSSAKPIPRRKLGKTGEELSIVGFAGIVVMNNSQSFANNIVAEAVDRGINYFDVAPSYGDAQARLGPALEPYRKNVFLACKEEDWTKDGCAKLLDESLRLLRTDHVDLYQFHASDQDVGTRADLRPEWRHGNLRSRQEGGKGAIHRLFGAFRGSGSFGNGPLPLRYHSLPDQFCALLSGEFRTAGHRKSPKERNGNHGP